MKKNVAAFLLGLMLGIKGVGKMTHLIYLGIIGAMLLRPSHVVWVAHLNPTVFTLVCGTVCILGWIRWVVGRD